MTDAFKQQIQAEARQAVEELLEQAKLKKGDVFVVGCSSSEIVGGHIGKDSSLEAAQAVYAGIAPVLAQRGIWLAAQCCGRSTHCRARRTGAPSTHARHRPAHRTGMPSTAAVQRAAAKAASTMYQRSTPALLRAAA